MDRNKIENITSEFLSLIKLPEENTKKLNYLMVLPDCREGFPEGFAMVSSALKASGRNVFTINPNMTKNPLSKVKNVINENNIDVVLTGGTSFDFANILSVFKTAKQENAEIVTIIGGIVLTADPVVTMEALGEFADYGVIGEGEITINALAYALECGDDPATLDGIICKRDGEWSVNTNYPFISDLNILPFPDLEGFEYGKTLDDFYGKTQATQLGSSKILFFSTSRGCPYSCTFCASYAKKYRQKSNDTITRLLDWALSLYPNIEGLRFTDDLTFANEETALDLCTRLKSYGLSWRASARVNMVTEKTLSAMKDSGCNCLLIGIESADNQVLQSMRKKITVEQIEKVLTYADDIGLEIRGNLIFGDEEETWETACNSLRWWMKNRKWYPDKEVWNIELFAIHTYPGSQIYKNAVERGLITDPVAYLKKGCPIVNVSKMMEDEYHTLAKLASNLKAGYELENIQITMPNDYRIDSVAVDNFAVLISGVCPRCKENIKFKSYFVNFGYIKCLMCNKSITANPIEYLDANTLRTNVDTVLGTTGVAVWPVSFNNFYWLMERIPRLKDDNFYFVSPEKITVTNETTHELKSLGEKKILTPSMIQGNSDIQTVLIPASKASTIKEIKQQIASDFPHIKAVIHIGELISGELKSAEWLQERIRYTESQKLVRTKTQNTEEELTKLRNLIAEKDRIIAEQAALIEKLKSH